MRHLLTRILIIFLAVCGITSCAPPVGSIVNDKAKYDFLMLRPNRILYELDVAPRDATFVRLEDLSVFVAEKGNYRKVNVTDPSLKIEIIMNPGTMAQKVNVVYNGYFEFTQPGRHIIKGTYGNQEDEYSIEVNGEFTNPGDGSDFVGIKWK